MKINSTLQKRLKPINNVKDALRNVPNLKCIASGSDYERLYLSLKKTDTMKYFSGIYSSSSVQKGKPSPDVFLYASTQMGFHPEECIVIEDSKAGMNAGLAADMKTFLYRPTYINAFLVPGEVTIFNDMLSLPSLIKKFSA